MLTDRKCSSSIDKQSVEMCEAFRELIFQIVEAMLLMNDILLKYNITHTHNIIPKYFTLIIQNIFTGEFIKYGC